MGLDWARHTECASSQRPNPYGPKEALGIVASGFRHGTGEVSLVVTGRAQHTAES